MRHKKPYPFIILTFVIAILLTILPLPSELQAIRPFWIMLVLIYWVLVMPEYVSVGSAWCLGLLLDVMQGTVLGQHALAMMLVAYLTYKLQYQLRVFPTWQQAIAVFLFISIAQLFILWSNALMGEHVAFYWQHWAAVLCSAVLWPFVYHVLHAYQVRYRIQLS